jgi:hypothetical protein
MLQIYTGGSDALWSVVAQDIPSAKVFLIDMKPRFALIILSHIEIFCDNTDTCVSEQDIKNKIWSKGRKEVIVGWNEHITELHNLYFPSDIRMIKSRSWVKHVACMLHA